MKYSNSTDSDAGTSAKEETDDMLHGNARLLDDPESTMEPRLPEGYVHIRSVIRALLIVADLESCAQSRDEWPYNLKEDQGARIPAEAAAQVRDLHRFFGTLASGDNVPAVAQELFSTISCKAAR